jgi:hypothetical protein
MIELYALVILSPLLILPYALFLAIKEHFGLYP